MRPGLTRRTVVASSLLILVIGAAFAVLLVAFAGLRDTTRLSTGRIEPILVRRGAPGMGRSGGSS